jgi:hypothetical protein
MKQKGAVGVATIAKKVSRLDTARLLAQIAFQRCWARVGGAISNIMQFDCEVKK